MRQHTLKTSMLFRFNAIFSKSFDNLYFFFSLVDFISLYYNAYPNDYTIKTSYYWMLTKQIFILFKPRQLVLNVYMLLTWSVPKPQNIVSKILPLTSQSDFHWILTILYHIKRLDEKSSQSKNAYYQVLKNPGSMHFLWADLFPFTISQNKIRTERWDFGIQINL